jgi:hypothetical protein
VTCHSYQQKLLKGLWTSLPETAQALDVTGFSFAARFALRQLAL